MRRTVGTLSESRPTSQLGVAELWSAGLAFAGIFLGRGLRNTFAQHRMGLRRVADRGERYLAATHLGQPDGEVVHRCGNVGRVGASLGVIDHRSVSDLEAGAGSAVWVWASSPGSGLSHCPVDG